MSVTWHNVYLVNGKLYESSLIGDRTPQENEWWAALPQNTENWIGRQERWNGHRLCPPVGMKAAQCIRWDMFERVLSAIKANPENWYQRQWHCGTSHCFAGFAEILDLIDRGRFKCALDQVLSVSYKESIDQLEVEELRPTFDIGRDVLNITAAQANWLFDTDRTLADFEKCLALRAIPEYLLDEYRFVYREVWP